MLYNDYDDESALWSWPGYENERRTMKSWLRDRHIPFNEEMTNEELNKLVIAVATGEYKKDN